MGHGGCRAKTGMLNGTRDCRAKAGMLDVLSNKLHRFFYVPVQTGCSTGLQPPDLLLTVTAHILQQLAEVINRHLVFMEIS